MYLGFKIDKSGVVGIVKLMIATTIIILILALAGPGRHFIDISRNATDPSIDQVGLGCVAINGSVNATLNDFQEAACIATDLINPFFILVVIGLAGAIIAARIVLRW